MRTVDVIAHILKREGVPYLSSFPTSTLIEAAAETGIRPIICRQERVGVGIADGYSRVNNGHPPGVFAMQFGPGAENAYAGVATAYSDAVPMLLLPLGHTREREGVFPQFSSLRNYAPITKFVEQITTADRVVDTMRRAFARLKMGRPGPVMVEIPADVAGSTRPCTAEAYRPVKAAVSSADPADVMAAAKALLEARDPVIHAGQGVLYAQASPELLELAELTRIPVMTTMGGKSAFPEAHPLSLGSASGVMNRPVYHFLNKADLVFAVGTSLTRHPMTTPIPANKTFVQATDDPIDIGKNYDVDYPVIGDAKLVLGQFVEAVKELLNGASRSERSPVEEIAAVRAEWLQEWNAKLTSREVPINPYRVISEFMNAWIRPRHRDRRFRQSAGSIMPFYRSGGPGPTWAGASPTGWAPASVLNLGAKRPRPEVRCELHGDAAFRMTGLDFETAVRSNITDSHRRAEQLHHGVENPPHGARARAITAPGTGRQLRRHGPAMGGWAERVEDPASGPPRTARRATEEGRAALLGSYGAEIEYSHKGCVFLRARI